MVGALKHLVRLNGQSIASIAMVKVLTLRLRNGQILKHLVYVYGQSISAIFSMHLI